MRRDYPDRFFDVGIAEQHAITFAAGLSKAGFMPVCAIYSTFLQRAYDEVLHDICIDKLPIVIAIDRAGIVGADGPTHHGIFDIAYLRQYAEYGSLLRPKTMRSLGILSIRLRSTDFRQLSGIRRGGASGDGIRAVRLKKFRLDAAELC